MYCLSVYTTLEVPSEKVPNLVTITGQGSEHVCKRWIFMRLWHVMFSHGALFIVDIHK